MFSDLLGSLLSSGERSDAGTMRALEAKLTSLEQQVRRTRELVRRAARPAGAGGGADVVGLVERALERVSGDPKRVLCLPARGYESTVESERAVVLGGSLTPRLLHRDPDEPFGASLSPRARTLWRAHVLLLESLEGEAEPWLELLTRSHERHEALLLVARELPTRSSELLEVLLINAERGILDVAIVAPPASESIDELADRLEAKGLGERKRTVLAAGAAPKAKRLDRLPYLGRVFVRRDTTIGFLASGAEGAWDALAEEVAVIRVGGADADEQQDRLLAVADRLAASGS